MAEVLRSNAFGIDDFESESAIDQYDDQYSELDQMLPPNNVPALTDDEAESMALTIARAADDRKAADIVVLKVGDVSYLADYFVIATGFTNVQVRAIARSIEDAVEEHWGRHPIRAEGMAEGRWVLQDYGEIIVHVFTPKERDFYELEAFWGHAQRIPFEPERPGV